MIWIFSLALVISIGIGTYISLVYNLREKETGELCAEDFEIVEVKDRKY